jgi:hypothetical protein
MRPWVTERVLLSAPFAPRLPRALGASALPSGIGWMPW